MVVAPVISPNPAKTSVRATAAQTRLRSHGARATVLSEGALLTLLDSRAAVESTIDRLIDILDALDMAGADLEDDDPAEHNGDAEPSLGAPENHIGYPDQQLWCQGGYLFAIDLEDGDDNGIADWRGLDEQMCRFIWGSSAHD